MEPKFKVFIPGKGAGQPAWVTIDRGLRRLRLNATLVEQNGFKAGQFIHFLELDNCWYFAINDHKESSGCKLIREGRSGLTAHSANFLNTFANIAKLAEGKGSCFYVQDTNLEWKGLRVFEILFRLKVENKRVK